MPEVPRISVQEAREKVQSRRALLVCGYEDEEKCNKIKLEGAISFGRFQTALSSLTRDRQAAKYQARGFSERHEEHALRQLERADENERRAIRPRTTPAVR